MSRPTSRWFLLLSHTEKSAVRCHSCGLSIGLTKGVCQQKETMSIQLLKKKGRRFTVQRHISCSQWFGEVVYGE